MVYLLLKKIWNMMRKNILLFINFVENCICDERIYIYDLKKKKWCQCKYESHAIFILLSEDDLFIVYVFENIHTVESIVNEKRKLFLLYSINQSCAFMNMEIEKCRWHTAIMQVSYKSRKEKCFDIMPIKYWQIFINEIKSKFTSFHQYI